MNKLLSLDESHVQALKDAAVFCNKLAAVEHAHIIENAEEVDYLLSGIDPVEARNVAWTLTTLWQLWNVLPEDRGGTSAERVPPSALAEPASDAAPIPIFRCNPDESAGFSVKT